MPPRSPKKPEGATTQAARPTTDRGSDREADRDPATRPIPKDLVAASATPLVLSILARGDSYGYAIIQRVRELSAGRLEWTDGMLYPILHRLEEQRLIESFWRESETGRKRKYYRIKDEGRRALDTQRAEWDAVHAALALAWGRT